MPRSELWERVNGGSSHPASDTLILRQFRDAIKKNSILWD